MPSSMICASLAGKFWLSPNWTASCFSVTVVGFGGGGGAGGAALVEAALFRVGFAAAVSLTTGFATAVLDAAGVVFLAIEITLKF